MVYRFKASCVKHGIEPGEIVRAWELYIREFEEGEDPLKLVRLGFSTSLELIEVGANVYKNGDVVFFHAMKARKKYLKEV